MNEPSGISFVEIQPDCKLNRLHETDLIVVNNLPKQIFVQKGDHAIVISEKQRRGIEDN